MGSNTKRIIKLNKIQKEQQNKFIQKQIVSRYEHQFGIGSIAYIKDLQSRPHFNGLQVKIIGHFDYKTKRFPIHLTSNPAERGYVKIENLSKLRPSTNIMEKLFEYIPISEIRIFIFQYVGNYMFNLYLSQNRHRIKQNIFMTLSHLRIELMPTITSNALCLFRYETGLASIHNQRQYIAKSFKALLKKQSKI